MEDGIMMALLEEAGLTFVETVDTQWLDAPPELRILGRTVYKAKERTTGRPVLLIRYPKSAGEVKCPTEDGFLQCVRKIAIENEDWQIRVFATPVPLKPLVQLVQHQHAMLNSVVKLNVLDNDCLFALLNALVKTCLSSQASPHKPQVKTVLATLHPEQVFFSLSPAGLVFQWLPIPDSLLASPNPFLAPELRGAHTSGALSVDGSSDIWTIGALLLFLAVQVAPPAESDEAGWSLSRHVDEVLRDAVRRQHWRDYVSEDLRQIIAGCLCPREKRMAWSGLQSLCLSPRKVASSLRRLSLHTDRVHRPDLLPEPQEAEEEEEEEGWGEADGASSEEDGSGEDAASPRDGDDDDDDEPDDGRPPGPVCASRPPLSILTDRVALSPPGSPPRTPASLPPLSPFSSVSSPGLSPLSQSSRSVSCPSPPPASASPRRRAPPPASRLASPLSPRLLADVGPAEVHALYYRATTLYCSTSLQQLLALASPLQPRTQPWAALFVMRMYAHGLARLSRDVGLAEQYCQRGKAVLLDHIRRAETSTASPPPDALRYVYFLYSTCFAHGLGGEPVDPPRAIHYCALSAVLGYSSASNYLAYCYKVGELVEKNAVQALHYYRQAADAGHAAAQWQLASWYDHGRLDVGLARDPALALHYWELSAQQGHYLSLNCLGNLYYLGKPPVQRDHARAARYYQASAQAGNYYLALNNLASCHYYGEGVRKNWKKAVFYYRKAACQPPYYAPAQYNYAVCLEYGEGVEQNVPAALHYYTLSAEQGYREAQYSLARHFETGSSGAERDLLKALHYYKAAAEQGHADSRLAVQRLLR